MPNAVNQWVNRYNRCFHAFLIFICGCMLFFSSLFFFSEILAYYCTAAFYILSVLFTKLILRTHCFSHQFFGFGSMLIFIASNVVFVLVTYLTIEYRTRSDYYHHHLFRKNDIMIGFFFLAGFIPLREVIEKIPNEQSPSQRLQAVVL